MIFQNEFLKRFVHALDPVDGGMQCKRKRDFGVVGGLSCKFLVRSISQAGDAALADIAEKKVVVEGFRKIVGVVSRRCLERHGEGFPKTDAQEGDGHSFFGGEKTEGYVDSFFGFRDVIKRPLRNPGDTVRRSPGTFTEPWPADGNASADGLARFQLCIRAKEETVVFLSGGFP